MAYVVAIPVLVFVVALLYGGLTRRVHLSSCCAAADPARDLRMRDAFEEAEPHTPGGQRAT